MPLLDIATAQPSFQNHVFNVRVHTLLHNKFVFGDGKSLVSGWKHLQFQKKATNADVGNFEMQSGGVLMIRAIATLEPKCLVESDSGHGELQLGVNSRSTSVVPHQSSSEDSEEVDERETLRRMRISKANKGNMPWNKGRKHSAETLQRIQERTRLAMQHPKVKMKLANLGHAQSEETRIKIGVGVRMGWERRREKLMLQETCYFEWQNLIAEASRKSFLGEEELEWDSYKVLDKELNEEWLASVEKRKRVPQMKFDKRAPKPLEQRRKISEAISAKWADPEYRGRVCSALSKYHGTPVGAERKLRRPSCESQPRTEIAKKNKVKDSDTSSGNVTKSQNHHTRLRKGKKPLYKDPLASSKLEMIKTIRAHREAAADTEKIKAIKQAKLLIAEAEKAAKALEAAALRSPLAQASLIETRKLIAEAIQSIQSIEIGQIDYSQENDRHPSMASTDLVNCVEEESNPSIHCLRSQTDHGEINGIQAVKLGKGDISDLGFSASNFQALLNSRYPTSSTGFGLLNDEELHRPDNSDCGLPPSKLNGMVKSSGYTEQLNQLINGHDKKMLLNGDEFQSRKEETPPDSVTVTKKWVRGRLVEMVERD